MLNVYVEDMRRLWRFLSQPTVGSKEGQSVYVGHDTFLPPIKEIDIGVLSTGTEYRLSARINTTLGTRVVDIGGQKIRFPLPLAPAMLLAMPPLELPESYKEVRIEPANTIKIVDQNDVVQFTVYIYEAGYPAVISAGLESIPSGIIKKITTREEFERDINLFAQIVRSFVSGIYKAGVFLTHVSDKGDKSTKDKIIEIANTNQTLIIRAPLSMDEMLNPSIKPDTSSPKTGATSKDFEGKPFHLIMPDKIEFDLDDVVGIEQEKEDVLEVMRFMEDPARYIAMGAKRPTGILLTGPPGTGKTMLGKALAKGSKNPFIEISGSDFVNRFVGVGASNVRELFTVARKFEKCIIYIEEIDGVAIERGGSGSGGDLEYNQTVNALLDEMDGFASNEGLIIIAATNRPEMLDRAITRPGRFDRKITLHRPDIDGREAILKVHFRNKPIVKEPADKDFVDFRHLARNIPGFTGADIALLANESALWAIRCDKTVIGMAIVNQTLDKMQLGRERGHKHISKKDLEITAAHETGHAVVAHVLAEFVAPIKLVTIIPRENMQGYLSHEILEEVHQTKYQLFADMCVNAAGRAAEEIVFGKNNITTGAMRDIENASEIADKMIRIFGMTEEIGLVHLGMDKRHENLGYRILNPTPISQSTQETVDKTKKDLTWKAFRRAQKIIREHLTTFMAIKAELLGKEILTRADIERIFKDHEEQIVEPRVEPRMAFFRIGE